MDAEQDKQLLGQSPSVQSPKEGQQKDDADVQIEKDAGVTSPADWTPVDAVSSTGTKKSSTLQTLKKNAGLVPEDVDLPPVIGSEPNTDDS